MIKLVLALDLPPQRAPEKKEDCVSIDERIEYAVDCIVCDHEKQEAILFLQKLYNALSSIPNPKKGDQKRIEYIRAALSDYGLLLPDVTE
jgi:hypothetical protein